MLFHTDVRIIAKNFQVMVSVPYYHPRTVAGSFKIHVSKYQFSVRLVRPAIEEDFGAPSVAKGRMKQAFTIDPVHHSVVISPSNRSLESDCDSYKIKLQNRAA